MDFEKDYLIMPGKDLDPEMFDLVPGKEGFDLYYQSQPWLTPAGRRVSHTSERVLREIINDLQVKLMTGNPVGSYLSLVAYKIDILDHGTDPFHDRLNDIAMQDPFVRIKISGSSAEHAPQINDPLFAFKFNTLSGLITRVNQYTSTLMGEYQIEEHETHPMLDLVMAAYTGLDNWQKSVVHALFTLHDSGILMLLGLVRRLITPAEYSRGLVALNCSPIEQYGAVIKEAADFLSFLDSIVNTDHEGGLYHTLVHEGEGDSIEFKSTFRWDIRAGKTNPAIEHASLKTIAAFLNSRGGSLLIGVRDDGSVEGIETDKFANEDKFLLHLWTLIRTSMGRDFSPFIRTILEKVEEKTICIVNCQPATRPVFLRQAGFDEEMFIRVGPSSNALDISEALTYIRERFPQA